MDEVLTKTFAFIKFPKPTTKKRKTMLDYAKNKRVAPLKRKRKHLPSISALKRKADNLFSLYIRSRDSGRCVLCKKTKDIQCGHLIKRGKMSTRFDEINCNALCSSCNYKDNFEPQHYVLWFLKEYGAKMYEDLVERSKGIRQMKRCDYEEIISRYMVKSTP